MKSIIDYDYPNGYDYKSDSDKICLVYDGDFDTYVKRLISYYKSLYVISRHVYLKNFELWCVEIGKIKEKQYINNLKRERETKLNELLK